LRPAELPGSVTSTNIAATLDPKAKKLPVVSLDGITPASLIYELEPAADPAVETVRLQWSVSADDSLPPIEIDVAFTDSAAEMLVPDLVRVVLGVETSARSAEQKKKLEEFRTDKSSEYRKLSNRVGALGREIDEVDLQIPTTLVMEEMAAPRPTHVLLRGAYDKPGDAVQPQTPASLPPMADGWPRNRLGLARWLTDPSNPLPARVIVNRLWQSIFGTGLVRTAEDFGVQGEPPSHPELLDWLATEFMQSGWDLKAMMRLMVTSATYRQSSKFNRALLEIDPQNRLLARGPRFRLQSEFIRDQALAVSGLLVSKTGGPSVRPYHPPGLYEQVVAGSSASTYVTGQGEELYRRSLYTYWKRSVPNPAMLLFDSPFREACTVRRPRTNTPLQALNLMNDPTFVEAARLLGYRIIREGGESQDDRLAFGFRVVSAREPRPAEIAVLKSALARGLREFSSELPRAGELLKVGATPFDCAVGTVELAAYTTVASILLNLDEVVMKE
jgi:hypothetical protein